MSRERTRLRAARVAVDEGTGELVVEWRDGHESRYSLPELRRACPCAACRERQQQPAATPGGELVLLDERAAAASARVARIERVGHYGIRIAWADGHDYGIYTFEALRERDAGSE
ncbi:MAG: DUF971 domain-containing protein [Candidatus Latescibacterota bacterium]